MLAVIDGEAALTGALQLLQDPVLIGDRLRGVRGNDLGQTGEPFLRREIGEDRLADARGTQRGVLAADLAVRQLLHPRDRMGDIQIQNVRFVRDAEVDDLPGALGGLKQEIVHRVRIAEMLVDDERVLEQLVAERVFPVGKLLQIAHLAVCRYDVVRVGLADPELFGDLGDAELRLADREAFQNAERFGKGTDDRFAHDFPSVG